VTSPSSQLKGSYPPDTNFRIGVVQTVDTVVRISVSGNIIECGFLDTGVTLVDEDPVLVLRTGSSWTCLGRIVDTAP
jgi:hypothetical protein